MWTKISTIVGNDAPLSLYLSSSGIFSNIALRYFFRTYELYSYKSMTIWSSDLSIAGAFVYLLGASR